MLIRHVPWFGCSDLSDAKCCSLAQRCVEIGLALLLILSEVFSSNIQATLPTFSLLARLALTGCGILLLLVKCVALTRYENCWQWLLLFVVLAYSGFVTVYGGDEWFVLAALLGISAKDVDLRRLLRVYLAVAVACLLLVRLLHIFTTLIPFTYYCRNWDFGYGHYNGYGARILGIFFAWAWLRWLRLRWFDWAGLVALALYTLMVPGCRGSGGTMLVLLFLFAAQRILPHFFASKVYHLLLLAVYPVITAFSIWISWWYDPATRNVPAIFQRLNSILSGRFEVWHNVFWSAPISLFGGLATDGDEHSAIDNMYLALPMNKGILGAVVVAATVLLLLWRLAKGQHTGELLCMTALLAYLFMENKPFLLSANPLIFLLPCVLFALPGKDLPVVCPHAPQKQKTFAGQPGILRH